VFEVREIVMAGPADCRDALAQQRNLMKVAKVLLVLGLGGLAAHFLLKRGANPALAEGLGSFGPDPMDEDLEAPPGEPIQDVLWSSSNRDKRPASAWRN
jgi:hypothetical protein